jgi:hypothetical protein
MRLSAFTKPVFSNSRAPAGGQRQQGSRKMSDSAPAVLVVLLMSHRLAVRHPNAARPQVITVALPPLLCRLWHHAPSTLTCHRVNDDDGGQLQELVEAHCLLPQL